MLARLPLSLGRRAQLHHADRVKNSVADHALWEHRESSWLEAYQ
jgi:hypothetical protein